MTSPSPDFDFAMLGGAIQRVPELQNSPTLTATVAQAPGDPLGNAQALVGSAQQANAVKVVQHAHSTGIFGHLAHALSGIRTGIWDNIPGHTYADQATQGALHLLSPLGTVTNLANKPLQDVQHDYRYLRDVYNRHGAVAGLAETLGLAVTAGVGGYFGGAGGAALGAEAAGSLEQRMFFHDSANRTRDGSKYTLNGQPVSIGRDVAHAIGLDPKGNKTLQSLVDSIPIVGLWLGDTIHHANLYQMVSGAIDGSFDVAADPLLGAGQLATANRARTAITSSDDFERIAGDAMKLHNGANVVGTTTAAGRPTVTTAANRAYRMFTDVAGSDTGQIIEHYPTLRPLAPQLGAASTVPDVIDVFRNNLATSEMLGTKGIPSYSVTRIPARHIADSLRSITPADVTDAAHPQVASLLHGNAIRSYTQTVVRAMSNRTPFALDPTTNELLTTGWDPSNPRAAGILYKVVRLNGSAATARAVAARFGAETDPAKQYEIWQNAHAKVIQTELANHGVKDPKVIERVVADLTDHGSMSGAGRDSKYGYGPDGNPVDRIPVGDGATTGSPLWETQAGKLYTINPSTLKSVAQRLSSNPVVRATGKIDDGLYNNIIAPLFKPQALLTGGFAFRNAGNEMLTRVIGGDGLAVLRAGVEKTADKIGYRLMKTSPALPDEVDHVTAALAEGVDPHLLLSDPHLLDTATRAILESDGHILPPAAQAGHVAAGYGGDNLSDLKDNTARVIAAATGRGNSGTRLDPTSWVDYTSANGDKFPHALAGALAMVARDPAGPVMARAFRDALDAGRTVEQAQQAGADAGAAFLRDTERGQYQTRLLKSGQVASAPEANPVTDLATRRMLALRGLVTGQNGEVNQALLDGLAEHNDTVAGRTAGMLHPNLHPDTIGTHPLETLPVKVAGMEAKPVADIGAVQRIQNQGFTVLSGVINRLSREPIYLHHLDQEYTFAKTVPGLTDDEAWQLAKTRAVERMIPEIHNPLDRSQFALAARNFIPFFFAREQAYRRIALSVAENPVGFRKVQVAGHAMKNIGFVHTDPATGQDYFNYPLSGYAATVVPAVLNRLGVQTAVGVPGGFRGTIQGLYAGGEAPDHLAGVGWSPILSIPARALASLDPQLAQMEARAEGPVSASQSTLSMFFPNSAVRSIVTALDPQIQQRSFNNAQIDALQYAIARGDLPPNPTLPNGTPDPAYSAWMDRFQTHTRIMYGLKGLFGIGAPSSPQLKQGSAELTALAASYLHTKHGLADGTRRLFQDHPNLTSYEVFRTTATSGLPDTQRAVAWAARNSGFISKFGKAATFFAPQQTTPDPAFLSAERAEIGLGLRQRRTPDNYVHEVVSQTGWNEYQASKAARDAAIAAHPGDNDYAKQQYANFSTYLKNDLGHRNPVWYSEFQSLDAGQAQKQNLVTQVRAIINSKAYPASAAPSAKIITSLLADYDQHLAALTGKGNSGLSGAAAQAAERANWQAYLTGYVHAHPEAAVIVNRLFKGA